MERTPGPERPLSGYLKTFGIVLLVPEAWYGAEEVTEATVVQF